MTLAEMRRNVRYALGLNEPEELPIIDQKINDGVRDVLRRTGCTVLCFDATTPDNENRVTLAPGIMRVMHVTRNGARLDRVPYESIRPGAFAQVGDVLIFYTAFSPDEKLQIWGVPGPTKLAQPTDALEQPAFGGIKVEWQDAVQLYALAELAGLSNDETSGRGGNYRMQYEGQTGREGRLAEIRRQVNKMSGVTVGRAQLEYRLVGLRR